MPQYRIEISPNNRAVCKETKCKKEGDKITKDSIRWGTWVEIESIDRASWTWKHWGCVSGAMIANVREAIAKPDGTYDFDAIDGYDELNDHPDVQAKIRRAIEQGHIDVEDFKGDPEKCKLGERGIWLTKKQKENIEKAKATEDGESPPPKKAKRGRKKEELEDEEDAPKPKKARKSSGKAAKAIKDEEVEEEGVEEKEGEEEPVTAKPARSRKPTGKKVKDEDEAEAEDEATAPAKKVRKPTGKVKAESEDEAPVPVKRGRKPAAKAKADASKEEEPQEKPAPARKSRRSSAVANSEPKAVPKRARRSGAAPIVPSQSQSGDEAGDQEEEPAPTARGRRGATKTKTEPAAPAAAKGRRGRPRKV